MKEMWETPGASVDCIQGETQCITLELKETHQRLRDCMPNSWLTVDKFHSADNADPMYSTSEAFTMTTCSADNCNTVKKLSCGMKVTGAPFDI